MQPFNYTLDAPSTLESGLKGFEAGTLLQQKTLANQAAQQKLIQQQQMQTDLAQLASNPMAKASDYARVMTLYPSLSEHLKRGFDTLNADQQRTRLSGASQVFAAINAGNNPVAIDLLNQQAQAYRNGGNEQAAKEAETIAKLIELHPETAKASVGTFLAATMGPEKFADTFKTLGQEARETTEAPVKLKKLTAEATKAERDAEIAAVKSRFAERNEVADLEKKGWDVKKLQNDIDVAKANVRIAAMNAAIAKANSETNRAELTLKRDKFTAEEGDKLRAKVADVSAARTNMDNFLNTADRIINTPKNVIGSAAGPISARIPTTSQSTADFEALVENLGAQAFLSQIPQMKGLGALSDAEGKKITASLQNFSLTQSPERLVENVQEAQRIILKARKNLTVRYGIPDDVPDTPAAKPAGKGGKSTDAMLRELGVMK